MSDRGGEVVAASQDSPADGAARRGVAADAAVEAAGRTRITPRRTVLNYWVDLGLLVVFLTLSWVTGVTQFVFPSGPEAFACRLWGGDYGDWRDIQFGLTVAFGLGVLLHLMLHWNWLCSVTNTHLRNRPPGRDDGSRTLLGVGVLVAILHVIGIGLLLAWAGIEVP